MIGMVYYEREIYLHLGTDGEIWGQTEKHNMLHTYYIDR